MRFDATKVVALKVQNKARRLEIRLADETGIERIVTLPLPAAIELAQFVLDAVNFMIRVKRRSGGSRAD